MGSLNPYDFLGVTIDSTAEQVRRSYHSLALLLHPDRGGHARDMLVLQHSYEYVISQINAINRTTSFEDLAAAFERFCIDQRDATVLANIREIEDAFYRRVSAQSFAPDETLWRASHAGGYADSMASSSCCGSGDNLTTPVPPFAHQMVVYDDDRANRAAFAPTEPQALETLVDETTDFSVLERPLHMSDYRAAHARGAYLDAELPLPSKTLEQLLEEREALNAISSSSVMPRPSSK